MMCSIRSYSSHTIAHGHTWCKNTICQHLQSQ